MSESAEKKYKVHIFAVVRVPINIKAKSPLEAARRASASTDLDTLLTLTNNDQPIEYSGRDDSFLVDEVGDENHENSRYYDASVVYGGTVKKKGGG